MNKSIKNSFLYILPSILSGLLPLISLPIYTNSISLSDFGALALCQSYAIIVVGLSNFGVSIGFERNFFESEKSEKRVSLLYTTIVFLICTSFLFGIFTFTFKDFLVTTFFKIKDYSDLLVLAYFANASSNLKSIYLIYLKNVESAKDYVWYTISESLGTFGLSTFFLVVLKIGVNGISIAQLISALIVFFHLSYRFIREYRLLLDIPAFKSLLNLSILLTPRFILTSAGTQIDKYIVGLLSGIGGLGVYSLAQKIGSLSFVMVTAIQNVWSPFVYRAMFDFKNKGRKLIGKFLTPYFYFSLGACLSVALFSEEFVKILTPPDYHGATDIASIFSLLNGLYFFTKTPQLLFTKKIVAISLISLLNLVLNLMLIPTFISFWGLYGAVFAVFIGGIIGIIVTYLVSQHYYRIHWERSKILIIVGFSFAAIFTDIILRFYDVTAIIRFPLKIAWVFLFLFLGVFQGIITRSQVSSFKAIFQGYFRKY